MAKEALVIVLDVGKSMGERSVSDGRMTNLDKAKCAFRLMVQQKLLFGYKQDVAGVVLFNSSTTNNECHEEHGGYESIEEYFALQTPNLDLLECIDNVQSNKQATDGDALDALLVAAQIILNFVGTKKYTKRIFMITDAATKISDIEQIEQIAGSFLEQQISFNLIGIGFGEEKEDDNDEDDDDNDGDHKMKDWNDIQLTDNHRNARSEVQVQNEKILRYFSHLVNGKIYSGQSAISMMSELRSKSVLLRPTYSGSFRLTPSISMQCKLYCRCREQTLPSLKKESAIGSQQKKVSMDRLYKNKFRGNEDDEEVEEDERVKSYLYGKERVPFTETDELRLNYKSGERHFECLGFISAKSVKRHYFMGPAFVMIPDLTDAKSQYLLSSLVQSCFEKQLNCLCRLVSRKNSPPKYVVLQPRIKSSKHLFILNELPFFEDVRKFPFASFRVKQQYTASDEDVNCCRRLIQSLNLMEAAVDEDGDSMEALKPQQTFNPVLQRFYQNLQIRALDSMASLQELDPLIVKYLQPDAELFSNENTKKCFSELKSRFPTKFIPKKLVKKERGNWNDMEEAMGILGDIEQDDNEDSNHNKNEKGSDGASEKQSVQHEVDVNALIEVKQTTEIGTQEPIKDFEQLFSNKDSADLFNSLCVQMWQIIQQLVDAGFGSINYKKVFECVEFLKQKSIREEEYKLFNAEFTKFKSKYSTKKKKLWNLFVEHPLSLICAEDFEDVPDGLTVSKSESLAFLHDDQMDEKPKVQVLDDDSDGEEAELV